ncbi:bifunctional 3-(3-hydroxy-phenyl)propionate/3-hydroxycinnamic acid hydroxylase [Aquihabitans sp. G128]|uniref:bifunctional 3-(3-hydroxy-phenyl)propionate/3-hydroxycinnamic acid hydroxylase MhpA n=1 Tax=Aquihabitans sp. G128 TaxID=2849779 RepID=UPI001C21A255|nr:bifunctional 3-(3-hydroxy-phenyl)propionate/3-hydroxycinnamic acid hydroxylase [Aquihabitans sp. G128]QXC60895.1 bifunctional 3-(3-hydroxy-phenyl)propionate/3-hydroxycinnamic acid hydroxylase [Aquihabitans sp. G128]
MAEPQGPIETDVAIVGWGPVGAVLAILLAQQGHRVVVLERWLQPYPLPRAVHFDHEVGRILQGCRIGADLRAASEAAEVYEWRNGAGTTLLRFGRIGAGTSGWPESSMFNQPTLEALLHRRAAELPTIELRRGVEVTGLEQDATAAVVHGTDPQGAAVEVRARYVVGCDGANSTVRALVDTPVHDLGFFYDWLIVDVVLDQPRVFDPLNLQVCDPARPTTAVSGGPGRRRWEFMRLPEEAVADVGTEARAWELLAPWAVTPANATLERHAVYTFNARFAERWRTGRVLLAGDAAHQMPPFAGQGLCSGLRDVANLSWKVDHVLRGLAPEALLDTYEQERLPDARAAIDLSMALGKVICVPDPAEAAARDAAMSASVGSTLAEAPEQPPLAAGLLHPAAPRAGHLSIQARVGSGEGGPALLDDVLPAGWHLVTVAPDAEALDDDARSVLAGLGGSLAAIGDHPGAWPDVEGRYAAWFADHGCRWALQRPDRRLYGTAATPAEAGDLLRDLRTRLAAPG